MCAAASCCCVCLLVSHITSYIALQSKTYPWEPVVTQLGAFFPHVETEQKYGTYTPASLTAPPGGFCVTLMLNQSG